MKNSMLGDFIKECRTKHGLSLRDMESKTGVSASQISKIERGISKPTPETLDHLAYALNVDRDSLYILAGLLSDEIVPSILLGGESIIKEVAASYRPITEDSLDYEVLNLLRKYTPEMKEEELDFIRKEVISAIELSKKRLRPRN